MLHREQTWTDQATTDALTIGCGGCSRRQDPGSQRDGLLLCATQDAVPLLVAVEVISHAHAAPLGINSQLESSGRIPERFSEARGPNRWLGMYSIEVDEEMAGITVRHDQRVGVAVLVEILRCESNAIGAVYPRRLEGRRALIRP
jgi:hypothetical protein